MKKSQSRREFLKLSAAGTLGAIVVSQYGCGKVVQPGIGLQLYTVRDAMAVDVTGSLQKVADAGYKYLELAGYADGKFYGYEPAEFKKLVNGMGMDILSSHTQVEAAGITLDNAEKMAADHAKIGVKYCIQPWIVEEARTTIASYQKMAADWNKVGGIMKKHGIKKIISFDSDFDKVKETILRVIPALSLVGDGVMFVVHAITDFIGATSEAEREVDRLSAAASKSLKNNEQYLKEHGSQLDEYTKQKIAAKNEYLKLDRIKACNIKIYILSFKAWARKRPFPHASTMTC